jgi:CRISPR-associated protein Csm3
MSALKIKNISGTITLNSGLHIGGGDSEMHIGGVDNEVIKDPITNAPYIPGSSLKGKIRSLLEYYVGSHLKTDGKPLQYEHLKDSSSETEKNIVKLFGTSGSEKNKNNFDSDFAITRLIFTDAYLTENSKKHLQSVVGKFTEIKAENSINRISGTAESPRFIERVPRGAEFEFSVTVKSFENDDYNSFEETLLEGFKLLTFDALGGSGSRGYGRISVKFNDEDIQKRFDEIKF